MDTVEIKNKVRTFIVSETASPEDKILNNSLIFKEGFIDSMGFVMITTFIEDEFDIKVTDADLIEENFESIDAITNFVLRKIQ